MVAAGRSIKDRLKLINIVSIVFVAVFISFSIFVVEFLYLRSQFVSEVRSQANIISNNSISSLMFMDQKRAEETLASLRNVSDIEHAAIYTNDGRILGKYVHDSSGNIYFPKMEPYGYSLGKDHLRVFQPVVFDNETLGGIYISASLKRLYGNLYRLIFSTVAVSAAAIAFALLMLGRLQNSIVHPISHLAKIMSRVTEERDYSIRASVVSNDELGMLATWFNEMLERIEQSNLELETHRNHLEELVAFRTTALEQTNELLKNEIQERLSTEAQLRESEEKFKILAEKALVGVFIIQGGVFKYVNPMLSEMSGYTCEELLGQKSPGDLAHPEDRAEANEKMVKLARGRSDNERMELRAFRKDGTMVYSEVYSSAIVYLGKPAIIGTVIDITRRKLAEKELLLAKAAADEASLVKSRILANMSHEIRTPLTAIIGMAELLAGEGLSAKQREYVEAAKSSAVSLLSLMNSMLDLSKMEAGKFELEKVDFDLLDVVCSAVNIFSPQVTQKGLALKVSADEGLPGFVKGDPLRLRQIIINLVGNAIKFTERGSVNLEVRRFGSGENNNFITLHFLVRDTGIGIKREDLARIFESFTQAKGSMTRRYAGTGLGLNIAMNLVKLMGGAIWVESEPGKGSVFHFTACFSAGAPVEGSRTANEEISYSFAAPLRILHVEDNSVLQNYVAGMLEKTVHEVKAAGDGKEALEMLSREDFDVVLMDIQMPNMDGFEAARTIRNPLSPVKNHAVPIIATTAYAMKGDRERCLECGMDAYMAKPFSINELFASISGLLPSGRSSSRKESSNAVIDQAYLRRLYGGNEELVGRIRADFLRNVSPARLDELFAAVNAGDCDLACRLSHSLKGAAGTIGARSLQDAALGVELAAREGDIEKMLNAFGRLGSEFKTLMNYLNREG